MTAIREFRVENGEMCDLSADGEKEINRFVHEHELGTLYHRTEWLRLIKDVFGHDTFTLTERNSSGALTAYLPLVLLESRIFGRRLVSIPFCNYGGSLANGVNSSKRIMDAAVGLGERVDVEHIELRSVQKELWPSRTEKVGMLLQLPKTTEELWKGLTAKVRAQVRRPEREGLEVVTGGLDILREFYDVFSRNMRDLGTPVYGREFFGEVLKSWKNSWITCVRIRGTPAAAGFFIGYKNRLEIPWASSLREMNKTGANMRLYWEGIYRAVVNDYHWFDFGRSSVGSGTYRFKQQWGARPIQLYWSYWLKDQKSTLPNISPSNPKYRAAIRIWRCLPLNMTNSLGPLIARHLS